MVDDPSFAWEVRFLSVAGNGPEPEHHREGSFSPPSPIPRAKNPDHMCLLAGSRSCPLAQTAPRAPCLAPSSMVRTDPWHPIFDDPYLNRDRAHDPGIRKLLCWPLGRDPRKVVGVFWTLGGAPEGMHIPPSPSL